MEYAHLLLLFMNSINTVRDKKLFYQHFRSITSLCEFCTFWDLTKINQLLDLINVSFQPTIKFSI